MQCHNLIYVALFVCFSGPRGQLSPINLCQTQATCEYSAANCRVEGKCTVQVNYVLEKTGYVL